MHKATKPAQILFLDIVPNNSPDGGLTSQTYFAFYLLIVCAFSRYASLIGLSGTSARDVIEALEYFACYHRPFGDYNFTDHLEEIHVDAGSQLIADELLHWAQELYVQVIAAAPDHQEMAGLCERQWQHFNLLSNKMLVHARLGPRFKDLSLRHATRVRNVLPIKHVAIEQPDGSFRPASPFELYFDSKPRVASFRVFGCPCIVRVQSRKHLKTKSVLHPRNIVQRGVRGVHVGFPYFQAGWLVYIPIVGKLVVSADVAFDELFHSTLAYNERLFYDAVPTRDMTLAVDPKTRAEHTGPPEVAPFDPTSQPEEWTHLPLPPDHADPDPAVVDNLSPLNVPIWDNFPEVEEGDDNIPR